MRGRWLHLREMSRIDLADYIAIWSNRITLGLSLMRAVHPSTLCSRLQRLILSLVKTVKKSVSLSPTSPSPSRPPFTHTPKTGRQGEG